MKPVLLALMFLSEEHIAQMAQTFEVIYAPDAPQAATAIAQHGSRVRVVLTIGAVGLSPAQIDALPALTLICALGAGYENVRWPMRRRAALWWPPVRAPTTTAWPTTPGAC